MIDNYCKSQYLMLFMVKMYTIFVRNIPILNQIFDFKNKSDSIKGRSKYIIYAEIYNMLAFANIFFMLRKIYIYNIIRVLDHLLI